MKKLIKSSQLYKRSKQVLAGPSTFSKGPDQFAYGISPYSLDKGDGAYVWDVDGNKYLDTIMALGPVILGYNNSNVNQAIKKQLSKGISFSLTHSLEVEVAEMLCERIPSAELVRFAKNGNDVTAAAIRLARHVTKSSHVLFCGYHGWQDWYACQTSMSGGIPSTIKDFSHRFPYNNLNELETLLKKYKGNVACIIMEATNIVEPQCDMICEKCKSIGSCQGYLQSVRELADKYNTILIFDEIVTGFRFHRGGFQSYSGVTPDLATFSKAISNGMPLSALVGKKEIMKKCPEILFTMTFAGEALSLAAAKETMETIDREDVIKIIANNGKILMEKIKHLITDYELNKIVGLKGYPQRNVFQFYDYQNIEGADLRTFWIQEATKKNILTLGYHMPSLAYKNTEIDYLINAYSSMLYSIKEVVEDGNLEDRLLCPTSKAFSIRE